MSWPIPPAMPAKTGASEAGDGGRLLEQRARAAPWRGAAAPRRRSRCGARCRRTRLPAAARRGARRPRPPAARRPGRRPRRRRRGRGRCARRGPAPGPASERTPLAASSSRSNGTPMRLRGSRRRAPRDQSPRGGGGRVHDVDPELRGERHPLGAAGQHRLGADVDGDPGDLGPAELAADLGRALEDEHVPAGGRQVTGGGQAADPGTHHDDVPHTASLPRRPAPGCGRLRCSVDCDRPRLRSRCGHGVRRAGTAAARRRRPTPMTTHAHLARRPGRRSRRLLGLVAAISMTAVLAACSSDDGASDASYESSSGSSGSNESPAEVEGGGAADGSGDGSGDAAAQDRSSGSHRLVGHRFLGHRRQPGAGRGRAARHLPRHGLAHQRRRPGGPPRRAAGRRRAGRRRHRGADRHRRGRRGGLRAAGRAGARRTFRRRDDRPGGGGRPAGLGPHVRGRQHAGDRHRGAGARPGGEPRARRAAAGPRPGTQGRSSGSSRSSPPGRPSSTRSSSSRPGSPTRRATRRSSSTSAAPPRRRSPRRRTRRASWPASAAAWRRSARWRSGWPPSPARCCRSPWCCSCWACPRGWSSAGRCGVVVRPRPLPQRPDGPRHG